METNNIEDITIENMLNNIFINTTVKKRRKEIVEYYRSRLVTDLFSTTPDSITEEQITKRIDRILNEDKKSEDPYLIYKDGKYSKSRRRGRNIVNVSNGEKIDTNYVGKAGECSVMAELLFNGYNVNNMMVDEGIDLVASKNNVFYYIQVKTRYVEEVNKFHFSVKRGNYERYVETQMRYVLVARARIGNDIRNIYFVFNNNDISRFKFDGIIGDSEFNININIEYDTRTDKAYAYNGSKRVDVSYNMNRFEPF